ncbi:hypothetical protein Tco_1415058 [Tanacetum coccineum]
MESWNEEIARLALCYPKNDRKDIGKLSAKGDIGFFIGYSANLCAYRFISDENAIDASLLVNEYNVVQFDGEASIVFENIGTGDQSTINVSRTEVTSVVSNFNLEPDSIGVDGTDGGNFNTQSKAPTIVQSTKINMTNTSGSREGKYVDILSMMSSDDIDDVVTAIESIGKKFLVTADNSNRNVIKQVVEPSHDVPIVSDVNINTKSTSYAGAASANSKDQPKVTSNFRPLVVDSVFDGVNISIPYKVVGKVSTCFEHTLYGYFIGKSMAFPVVEYYARNNWSKHGLKRLLFFKFDTHVGLEVKFHDVPIQVFKEDGISLIATFIEADLVDVVTIGIPSLTREGFTKETIRVEYELRPPRCDRCKRFGHVHKHCPKKVASPPTVVASKVVTPTVEKRNDGFQTVGKKKKKGKSKSTNGGQFVGPSVKQSLRYEPKATTSEPKKGDTTEVNASKSSSILKSTGTSSKKGNITTSNSYSILEDEEKEDEEHVENMYDESANLFTNLKTGKSSSFMTAAD